MIKKSIYLLLFVVSIISLLVGCDTKTEENMSVTVTDITIQIGEVYKIEVSNASGPVVFESSDSNIVTVNEEGQITGVSVGFANVTVSDSDESITCSITVLEIPYDGVHLISIDADVVDLIIGDEYELEPKLLRGTDVVEGAQFKYSSSDESVATVTNGVIKALKAGETTIQIDSVDYEKTSKNITVNVSNDFVIDLSESDLVLSKNNFLDYVNSKEVNFIVKEQGQKLDVENLSVSISDDNVVSVEKNDGNYLIKALNFGDAIITFSYTKEDGSETTSYINVSVVKPVV